MIDIYVKKNSGGKEYYSIPDESPSNKKIFRLSSNEADFDKSALRDLAKVAHDMTMQPQGNVECVIVNGPARLMETFDFAPF